MKSPSFANCQAEELQCFLQALLLMNFLLASELCLWSVPCLERIHSASIEQMCVLVDMKNVHRCREICHHPYQEVLLRMFSIGQHPHIQICARHVRLCKISFLAQGCCWQTQPGLIPSQLKWHTSFPRLLSLLKDFQCLIRMKTVLFSSCHC